MDAVKRSVNFCFNVIEQKTGWAKADLLQIFKYGVSGILGGILQVLFLYVFVDRLGLWYVYGVISAYVAALVIVFSLQKFWTFQDYSTDRLRKQSALYTIIALGALGLNVVMMYVLVDVLHMWHITAQVLVVAVVGAISYVANRMFTFTTKHV